MTHNSQPHGMQHEGYGVRHSLNPRWYLETSQPFVRTLARAHCFAELRHAAAVVADLALIGVRAEVCEFLQWRGHRLYRSITKVSPGVPCVRRSAGLVLDRAASVRFD